MPGVERQIMVNASAEKVFSYLADFPRHSEWAAHPLTLKQTSEGPVTGNTTYASTGHMMGKVIEDKVVVTEHAPNTRLAFEATDRAYRIRHYFLIQADGERTRLTKGFEALEVRPPFSLILPFLRLTGALGKGIDGDLARIKAKLEQIR